MMLSVILALADEPPQTVEELVQNASRQMVPVLLGIGLALVALAVVVAAVTFVYQEIFHPKDDLGRRMR